MRGGVNTSNSVAFRLCDLKSNLLFLLRRITNTKLMSFRTCFGIAMLFQRDHATLSHGGQAHEAHISPVRFVKRVQGDLGIRHTFNKALAFTLAETLIVMGIIGVVAALTIPNLNSSTGEKEKIAKVKKIYQNLEDALGRAQAVYGPFDEWKQLDSNVTAQTTRFAQRVTEFMKISKDCGMDTTGKCFVTKDREINGTYSPESQWQYNTDAYKVITADGTCLSFSLLNNAIYADIDGVTKGSSLWGSDLFVYWIHDNRIDPFVRTFENNEQPCKSDNDDCVAWVISYDNMDYLKTNDGTTCSSNTSKKLTWGGNHSCK